MSILTPEQRHDFDRRLRAIVRPDRLAIGYSGAGRAIERITYHEDVNGRQCCDVYFVGDTGFMCMSHDAATLAGLAHEMAVNYGVKPEHIISKRLS